MRKTMKTTLAVLASLAFIPAAATASLRVGSPFPGNVTATTYYSSGSFHGAVDISSGTCGYWGVQTGVVGSMFWNVTIRTEGIVCGSGSGSGNQNEVKHTFANDYVFRQWHFLKTPASVDKTCDRCQIGDEGLTSSSGSHTHMQYDRYGTNNTSWYSSYTTRGEFLDRGETVGYIQ